MCAKPLFLIDGIPVYLSTQEAQHLNCCLVSFREIGQAAIAIVKGNTRPIDVMEIKV